MRRTKLIASSVVIALVAVGSYVVADKPNTPVNDEVPVQETVQVEEVAEPVVEQEQTAPVTSQPVAQPQVAPQPVNPCIAEKAAALAPFQAEIDRYNVVMAERTAVLTETYHARKSVGAVADWVTLEYWVEDGLNRSVRPLLNKAQAAYDAEAAKFDC